MHRTNPIPDSITYVPGYPNKLTLYRNHASKFWQVRYFDRGKIVRRSTKTEKKSEAIQFARKFHDEILLRRAQGLAIANHSSFAQCAATLMKSKAAQLNRGEITEQTHKMLEYRIRLINQRFGKKDINDVRFEDLEDFVNDLSCQTTPKLKPTTIDGYLKVIHQVFKQGHKMRLLQVIPHFPTVSKRAGVRGYFTLSEYKQLWKGARRHVGSKYQYRLFKSEDGIEGRYVSAGSTSEGRLIKTVTITPELSELIVFMVNSFIRPTDIKNLKHKHVEIIQEKHAYLRLTLPMSKRHDSPIVTMPIAISVYKNLIDHNEKQGWKNEPEDYVFFPEQSRDNALKIFQSQFDVLMWKLGIGSGPKGEERTLYSLRHSCIMFRLMYGDHIDVVTLARNARTSPEMIDKHYASQLKGEDNIDMLQSRRKYS
jgi:hypothetical protein